MATFYFISCLPLAEAAFTEGEGQQQMCSTESAGNLVASGAAAVTAVAANVLTNLVGRKPNSPNRTATLKLMALNENGGFLKKKEDIKEFLEKHKPHILLLTETWLAKEEWEDFN